MPKLKNIMGFLLEEEKKGNVLLDEHGYFRSMSYLEKSRSEQYLIEMRRGTIPMGYSYEEYTKTHPIRTDGYVKIGDVYKCMENTFGFDYSRKKGKSANAKSQRDSGGVGGNAKDGHPVDK